MSCYEDTKSSIRKLNAWVRPSIYWECCGKIVKWTETCTYLWSGSPTSHPIEWTPRNKYVRFYRNFSAARSFLLSENLPFLLQVPASDAESFFYQPPKLTKIIFNLLYIIWFRDWYYLFGIICLIARIKFFL